ncbi:MAG: hypothetical protein GY719_09930 [bacterium]|nr:hypothetical protein [bacterium]
MMGKTEFLVTSIKTHKPTVTVRIGEAGIEIFAGVEGEAPAAPDWNQVQDWGVAALEASAAEVKKTDRAYRNNLVHLNQARQDRNETLGELKGAHRVMRSSFNGTYGGESLPLMGLEGVPARAHLAFREQIGEVVSRMSDPVMVGALPAPRAGQSAIAIDSLVEARTGEITELEDRMEDVRGARKRATESKAVRDETRKKHRRVYSNVARIQEGIYRLAGLDELADKIRATQRAARKKDDTGQPAETTEGKEEPAEQNEQQSE